MEAILTLLICTVIPVTAACAMHIKFAHERWVSYLEQKSSYKHITVSPEIFKTMLYTLSYEMSALPYGIMWHRPTSRRHGSEPILVYGRNRLEQEQMNLALTVYLDKQANAQARRKELANDVTTDLLKQVQDDIQHIIDDNLRTAQEAAKENQEIIERLSGTSTTRGGSP